MRYSKLLHRKGRSGIRNWAVGFLLALAVWVWPSALAVAETTAGLDGRKIMREVFTRHELYPYVFEEQTMIMTDRSGNRNVRKVRRFNRLEGDKTARFLLIFDHPAEIRGVALLAVRQPDGRVDSGIYLPAFGSGLISNVEEEKGGRFLGTDFAVQDLTSEMQNDFNYSRVQDQLVDGFPCFVVEAYPKNKVVEEASGYSLRRLFIRQDIFFVIRTDYYDRRLRFLKILTQRDLKRVDGEMWRANMILMESRKEQHRTLIKIDRRVFSHDYVPQRIFTMNWLRENMPAHHHDDPVDNAHAPIFLREENRLPVLLKDKRDSITLSKEKLDKG